MRKVKKQDSGITMVALIITIIVMLILAGVGIAITTGIIDKTTYSAFVAEMKNVEESVNMYIMEKNMETAKNGTEQENVFQTQLTSADLNELPVELKQEIQYVRDTVNNSPSIKASASEYIAEELNEEDLFFVDSEVTEGKEKAYVYDEQSKSIYKAKPTIISGKSMFGHDYGKIIGVQGLLATQTETPITITEGWTGKVNAPKIGNSGLIPITINEETGEITKVSINSNDWYDYKVQSSTTSNGGDSKWANAITKNDSNQITGMFVWIPRFAYKFTSGHHSTTAGTIEVVFLKDKTDKYEINGVEYTAKRFSQNNVDTNNQDYYVVHPCFTKTEVNGVKTYNQGEWDEELEGIWVAKFEAGFAGGDKNDGNGNTVAITNSNIKYGEDSVYENASNCYGTIEDNITPITYPVFLPETYSYANINTSDIFKINREIGNGNTFYNLNYNNVDTHMMKNSEWGALVYLSHSQYGRNGIEVGANDGTQWNIPNMEYGAKTGYEGILNISRAWNKLGKLASSTGNVYGVYDLRGGLHECIAAYIENPNGKNARDNYGKSLVQADKKYKTIYSYNSSKDDRYNNYFANSNKRGDAIYETSSSSYKSGLSHCAWYNDYYYYANGGNPFFERGGDNGNSGDAGLFAFSEGYGKFQLRSGFRTVICNVETD